MQYRQRPGIVNTKICDLYVLIPTRAAFSKCHTIQPLPMLWAITWDLLEKEDALNKILTVHKILTKKSEEDILQNYESFCKDLLSKGFLIEIDDDNKQ